MKHFGHAKGTRHHGTCVFLFCGHPGGCVQIATNTLT